MVKDAGRANKAHHLIDNLAIRQPPRCIPAARREVWYLYTCFVWSNFLKPLQCREFMYRCFTWVWGGLALPYTDTGWFNCTEPLRTSSCFSIGSRCRVGVFYMSLGWFGSTVQRFRVVQLHWTSSCCFSIGSRCRVGVFYISSGWFGYTEPYRTKVCMVPIHLFLVV